MLQDLNIFSHEKPVLIRVSFATYILGTLFLPLFGLVTCVFISFVFHFEDSTGTHCQVTCFYEISISSTDLKASSSVSRFPTTCPPSAPPSASAPSPIYGGCASDCTQRPGFWWRLLTSDFTRRVFLRGSLKTHSAAWAWPSLSARTSACCSSHMCPPVRHTVGWFSVCFVLLFVRCYLMLHLFWLFPPVLCSFAFLSFSSVVHKEGFVLFIISSFIYMLTTCRLWKSIKKYSLSPKVRNIKSDTLIMLQYSFITPILTGCQVLPLEGALFTS